MPDQDREIRELRELVARLTERVYRLEQGQGTAPAQPHPAQSRVNTRPGDYAPATSPPVPPIPHSLEPQRVPLTLSREERQISLESRIGSQWFNRVGIVAVLFGLAYFLKYAFENNWIGPSVRILIGIVIGLALMLWSERFRSRGYLAFSFGLKAVGTGALYLSLWAAFQLYHLVPVSVAFAGMVIVTAVTAGLAVLEDAEVLAALALVGGFITPPLLSTGQNHEFTLFSYLVLLDAATLVLLLYKPWRRLLAGSFVGTAVLYAGWYWTFYDQQQLAETLTFATIFFGIFAAGVVVAATGQGAIVRRVSRTALLVSFMNAVVYFLEAYVMLADRARAGNTTVALALAVVYIAMAYYLNSRGGEGPRLLPALHLAIGIAFVTAAAPLALDGNWITIAWLVEASALVTIAYRADSTLVKVLGVGVLALALLKLVFLTDVNTTTLFINPRFGTYLLALAALGWAVILAGRSRAYSDRTGRNVAIVVINVLALLALSLEVHDYYRREMKDFVDHEVAVARAMGAGRSAADVARNAVNSSVYRSIQTVRDFTYSAVWMLYGAGLMWIGFVRRSALLRWQAMALIAVTVVKVFVFDTSNLERIYRIASFIALGVLLLAISFAYQRDWLKLSHPERESGNS